LAWPASVYPGLVFLRIDRCLLFGSSGIVRICVAIVLGCGCVRYGGGRRYVSQDIFISVASTNLFIVVYNSTSEIL
jgi:hypothetical protein